MRQQVLRIVYIVVLIAGAAFADGPGEGGIIGQGDSHQACQECRLDSSGYCRSNCAERSLRTSGGESVQIRSMVAEQPCRQPDDIQYDRLSHYTSTTGRCPRRTELPSKSSV